MSESPREAVSVVHQGRGGHVELEGRRYAIEHVQDGGFCIHFPCGHRHARLARHLAILTRFALTQNPPWQVINRSRLHAPSRGNADAPA